MFRVNAKQKLEAFEELTEQKVRDYPVLGLSRPLNNSSPFVDRAEWSDQEPTTKLVREFLEQRRR